MTAETLSNALGGRKVGTGWMARCPAHDDSRPSLSVTEKEGKVLVICRAGCEQDVVIDALRSRGLWHESFDRTETPHRRVKSVPTNGATADTLPAANPPPPDFAALFKTAPSDFWDYLDVDGRVLGYTVRVDSRDGKKILPVIWDGEAWRCAGFPEPRPLYGLPGLAARPNAPVLIVEGEKAACAAQGMLDDFVSSLGRVAAGPSARPIGVR